MNPPSIALRNFVRGLLVFTLLVVLWGTLVRATFSGDGCGQSWPICGESIIPVGVNAGKLIEFIHRVSSGAIFGVMVLVLFVWVWKVFPKGSQARVASLITLVTTVIEGWVGAKLVKHQYVAHDTSIERGYWMSAHLINTFILLGSIVVVAWYAHGKPSINWRNRGAIGWGVMFALFGVLLIGVSGAQAALGDMLFPSTGLIDGLRADLDDKSHFFVHMRPFHPFIATGVGIFIVLFYGWLAKRWQNPGIQKAVNFLIGIYAFNMAFGLANMLANAPVVMQLVHLVVADGIWISTLVASMVVLSEKSREEATTPAVIEEKIHAHATNSAVPASYAYIEGSDPHPVVVADPLEEKPLWKDYLALTKPRIISLLLFTTMTAAFIAARGWPGLTIFVALLIGGYAAAGAANTFNMIYDRDIDQKMERTSHRPTVTQRISTRNAFIFAMTLMVGSFGLLWSACNLLSALMALSGLAFYVFVYTMALKRRTWQNIVIGGAAGAFPPLVGYAGVAGKLDAVAWILFAIIFLWTPVHFWALALIIKEEYRDAGIPMLPVVRGDHATVVQIAIYSVLTVATSLLPLALKQAGIIYLLSALLLNAMLFVRTYQLVQCNEKAQARSLFKYSMVYLAALFLMFAVDKAYVF